jgi:hypothetical protein
VNGDRRSSTVFSQTFTVDDACYDYPELIANCHSDRSLRDFISLALSRSKWLVTSLSPDSGEKLSRYAVAPDIGALLSVLAQVHAKPQAGLFEFRDTTRSNWR